jgi:hypothetical protein
MEELLPLSQRQPQPVAATQNIYTSCTNHALPDYFKSYRTNERKMLDTKLCDYSYLNVDPLLNSINCSLILNGVMSKTYSETYVMYLTLISNYSGIGLSQLGNVYRQGATYPVFLEICYIQRTLSSMLKYL